MLTDRSRIAISRNRFARPNLGWGALACSSLAIAVALTSAPTRAQSFLGSSTTTFGNAVVTTGTNTTTVTVNSPSAVIDWTPTDTATSPLAITWQPNGTTATFTGAANYAVLNRIVPVDPTRAIVFDGIVNSLVGGSPGGTVFFFSPGGIVASINSRFNIGNLGLTSSAPVVDGAGNWFVGNQVQFQASAAGRQVNTLAGAQINASAEGSFVALVAPGINHAGAINVNGQAALVSADASTITFNPSGLFDIQVTSGTSATGSTLVNSGIITGPASSGAGDNHRVYAVAVPKNTAITLAISAGSNLGFNVAGAADVVGNAVVLSAGRDIVGGDIAGPRSAGGGSGASDLNIANTTVGSSLRGSSTDETFFFSIGGGTARTFSTVNLQADTRATYTADGAGSVTTGNGMVTLTSDRFGNGVTGGQTDIFAINNGALSITSGGASLSSRGVGFAGATAGAVGGNATGGLALISAATGGDVSITGPVLVNAMGFGGSGNVTASGGTGTGGRAQIFARDTGSSITINGTALTNAAGIGGVGNGGGVGGTGTGGQAFINAQVAASDGISITGAASIVANGQGGNANAGTGGLGIGGTGVAAASVNNNVQFGSTLTINAVGQGGSVSGAGNVGSATGGTARIAVFATGTMGINGDTLVNAAALTGSNPSSNNSAVAQGGNASVESQQGSTVTITGNLTAGSGGFGNGSGTGSGSGRGGTTNVFTTNNGALNVSGVLRARSDGFGGFGGNATGGTVSVSANSGGDITANEFGGTANGTGSADTGTGAGFGTGGSVNLFATGTGSTINVTNGNVTGANILDRDFLSAQGFGGITNGGGSGIGGTGTGGNVTMSASAGAVLNAPATGQVRVLSRGSGGGATAGVAGGDAIGGTINIFADAATLTSGSGLLPSAFTQGGSVIGTPTGVINGGNSIGGTRNITVNNGGSMTISSPGGTAGGIGGTGSATGRGGNATGGVANITVDNNSTLNVPGTLSALAINSPGTGLIGGNATGGTAFLRVANGSTLTQTGPAASTGLSVTAQIQATDPTLAGATTGGTLTGGSATLVVENATLNAQRLDVTTGVFTSPAFYAQGSNSTGGTSTLQLIGGTLTADIVNVTASGQGGSLDVGVSGVAGNGTGGLARIIATGGTSTVNVAQSINIGAGGLGGNVGGASGTTTGNGTGGRAALVVSNAASLTLNAPIVNLDADGEGGEVLSGTADIGGFGTGGQTDVFANGGNITINGDLFLEADNDGGEGLIGGAGRQRTDGLPNALIRAANGTITVTGTTALASVGEGDNGAIAEGGFVVVDALNNLAGSSTITLNGLVADAIAVGGAGTAAPSPTATGGTGGAAFGGNIQLFGSAGNGNLVINGASFLDASAFGGTGGTGHPGATGTAGGVGGEAQAGFVQFGTKSGADTGTISTGSARFGSLNVTANATGGDGGVGGSGTTQGVGGAGGDGIGGAVTLLVRGSPVVIDDVVATTDGTGGAGGAGSVQGNGGGGYAGDGSVVVTQRFMRTERGTLTADNVSVTGVGVGGAGATPGGSFYALARGAENEFFVRQSDVAVANLTLTTSGDLAPDRSFMALEFDPVSGMQVPVTVNLVSEPFDLSVTDGTVDISGNFLMETPADMRVSLDNSTFNVGTLLLRADNFVLPDTRPAVAGTFNVSGGLDLRSNLDFVTYANFIVPFDTSFSWAGDFQTGDLTGGFNLFVDAVGSITTGNIDGNEVELLAGAGVTTGAIAANESIYLESLGAISTASLTAGDQINAVAGGTISVGNISAGIVDPSSNTGAEFNAGLRSLTSITAGNIAVKGSVGVASPGTISIGNVTSGNLGLGFLALAGTGLTTGGIDTTASLDGGRTYLANFSMEALGGQIAIAFDPTPILAATPVAIGGPITLTGPVTTGRFQAATTGAFSAQAISAPNGFELAAGNAITLGDLSSFEIDISSAQSLTLGAVAADGTIDLAATGTLTTGALTAGDSVFAQAGGALNVGAVSAGLVNPATNAPDGYTIGLRSLTSVTAGNLSARGSIGLSSPGAISVGNISGGLHVLGLAGTGFTSGSISTPQPAQGTTPQVYIANFSMETLGGQIGETFNPNLVFTAPAPVAINGSVAVNGPVATGSVRAAGTGTVKIGGPISTSFSVGLFGAQGVSVGTQVTGEPFAAAAITAGIATTLTSSAGAIAAGAITTGDSLTANGLTGVTLGNVSAGIVNPNANFTNYKIAVGSGQGAVSTGTLAARNDVGIQAAQSIATGNIAGRDVLLLPGTSLTTGGIQATVGTQQTGTGGRVFIGNFSSATQSANVFSTFQNLAIFSTGPVRTSGPITIGGTVTARNFQAATAQGFTAGTMTLPSGSTQLFGELFVDSGQTVTVNGPWRADFIQLTSNDIDITTTGTLAGFVELISTNQTVAVIGDISSSGSTQPGTGGYRLTDAEFDRISGGFSFGARDNSGEVDLLVGDLSVDASRFTLEEGGEIFVYSDDDHSDEDFAGRIRVDGNVSVTGAASSTSGNETFRIEFDAKSFELNAATGSVTIAGANGALAGAIEIEAENIHVASDEILLRLRADSRYEGSVQQLNAPAAVQRPDGVLRANVLQLEGEDTIYIQNTGSSAVPAGFVTRIGNETEDDDGTSIGPQDDDRSSTDTFKIVINGQLQTDTGLVTGKAAFDQIIAGVRSDLEPGEEFAVGLDPESTLNSCNIISGACAFGSSDPVASISSEVKLAIINQLADAPVPDVIEEAADSSTESADEEAAQSAEEEDEAEADEASAPIAPPAPLINTRPLNPAVSVVEPVAGAGNPALIGSAVNEATAQGDTP